MATDGGVKKRCTKCGNVALVKPRERRCKKIIGGHFASHIYCWGALAKVERKRAQQTDEQKLQHAHGELTRAISRVKRATTSVSLWQRRVRYFEARIDARDHPRPPRPKPIRKRRGIVVEE